MSNKLPCDPLNIVVCGIGGQGNILASELLGSVLVDLGYKVSVGETYGASQRGGSVMSHIRVSEKRQTGVLIPKGSADIIVGFEPLETLRMVRDYGNENTDIIFDNRTAYPLGVLAGESEYPESSKMISEIKEKSKNVYVVPAAELAIEAGNPKGANIALMGALCALPGMPFNADDFMSVISQRFTGKAFELNEKVFNMGREALSNLL